MEHYFQTKAMVFHQLKRHGAAVINVDDGWGKKAVQYFNEKQLKQRVIQFGCKTETPACPTLVGSFNVYNVCMAYLICIELGVSFEVINKALQVFPGVPGRLQMYTLKNGAQAFVDFAHKPGAFEEVLKTLRPLSTHLIVVFGCGGNRDKTKRPVMGKLAAAYADLVIITDDNPRDEDRQIIANDIIAGIPLEKMNSIIIELDRKKAITLAAQKSQSHSIIALLGKGHESYYLIKGKKYHHDDIEEIKHF
jgi:UDP-N-acetylmuramoyl-L-alanyl-D-glutamate--2,6-diaminopimelate ligase